MAAKQKNDIKSENLNIQNTKSKITTKIITSKTMKIEKVEFDLNDLNSVPSNLTQTQMNKLNTLRSENISNSNDDDDNKKWKEVVFKIKLTEAEYNLLIKEKAKFVNIK